MNRSRIKWICGAIAAFLAVAASADPPMYKFNNRTIGNSVGADGCHDFDGGYRCRGVNVSENYDVKGTFEYVEAYYYNERHLYDPSDESYDHRWRDMVCPVDEKSIAAHPNRVKIDLVLDSDDPGCYQNGLSLWLEPKRRILLGAFWVYGHLGNPGRVAGSVELRIINMEPKRQVLRWLVRNDVQRCASLQLEMGRHHDQRWMVHDQPIRENVLL